MLFRLLTIYLLRQSQLQNENTQVPIFKSEFSEAHSSIISNSSETVLLPIYNDFIAVYIEYKLLAYIWIQNTVINPEKHGCRYPVRCASCTYHRPLQFVFQSYIVRIRLRVLLLGRNLVTVETVFSSCNPSGSPVSNPLL